MPRYDAWEFKEAGNPAAAQNWQIKTVQASLALLRVTSKEAYQDHYIPTTSTVEYVLRLGGREGRATDHRVSSNRSPETPGAARAACRPVDGRSLSGGCLVGLTVESSLLRVSDPSLAEPRRSGAPRVFFWAPCDV